MFDRFQACLLQSFLRLFQSQHDKKHRIVGENKESVD